MLNVTFINRVIDLLSSATLGWDKNSSFMKVITNTILPNSNCAYRFLSTDFKIGTTQAIFVILGTSPQSGERFSE